MAELDTVMKSLDVIDNKIQTVVNDTTASVNAVKAEVKSLGEKQLEACKELAAIQQKLAETKSDAPPVDMSLGGQFTRDQSYIELSNNIRNSRGARVLVKTDPTPTTSVVGTAINRTSLAQPYEVPGIVGGPELPLLIESLIPHVPVSVGAVNYVKGSFTNGAAEVAEGGSKPETTFSMSLATASIQTVAHWTKITEQLAADAPAVTAYINAKMQYGLALKIDRQLVVGNGTSGAISGLLNSGNFTSYTSAISSSLPASGATLIDFALLIKTHLETLGYAPRYLVLNPADWAALALLKDEQGRYLLGGPANATGKQLWGIPVVTTAAVTSGKYLMADFALGATIFDRQEMAIEIDREGNDFTKNLLTIRCERRLGLVVEDAAAIGGGDWALPS